jgi:hypothetical protein
MIHQSGGSQPKDTPRRFFYAIWLGTLPDPEMPWLVTPRFLPIAPVLLHQDREMLPPLP